MVKGDRPAVCVVDTYGSWPPVPPRLSPVRQRPGRTQTLLILLVSVALCGMAIEACFIYRLYQRESAAAAAAAAASPAKQVANPVVPTRSPSPTIPPSKPVAHLTDGIDVVHGHQIMAWSMDAAPLLYELYYKDNSLVIQKEGYYHVYSKVSFLDTDLFSHSVCLKTERYGKSIPLLMSRKLSERSNNIRSNSHVEGVFHFHRNDALFVKVSNTSHIARQKPFENVFGVYMI